MSRIGKIARLPLAIRETLNSRLEGGEPYKSLLAWLNTEPAAKAVLKKLFAGRPITDGNISDWRKGGYRDWRAERAARAMLERVHQEQTDNIDKVPGGVVEQMAAFHAAQLLVEMQTGTAPFGAAARVNLWREFRLALASLHSYKPKRVVPRRPLRPPSCFPSLAAAIGMMTKAEPPAADAENTGANRFDKLTQTWSGPNANAMNRKHRRLLLEIALNAGAGPGFRLIPGESGAYNIFSTTTTRATMYNRHEEPCPAPVDATALQSCATVI
jgi:hypothetical protein